MRVRSFALLVLIGVVCSLTPGQSFSEFDRFVALRSAELRKGGRVMLFALVPGQEDLVAGSYYRFVAGAQVRVVYLTNGEAEVASSSVLFPQHVAAAMRDKAYRATQQIDADHAFLNLPHLDGAASTSLVESTWGMDSLRARLRGQIDEFQPDLVLVNGFERPETPDPVRRVVRSSFADVLQRLNYARRPVPAVHVASHADPSRSATGQVSRGVNERLAQSAADKSREVYRDTNVGDSPSEVLYVPFADRVPPSGKVSGTRFPVIRRSIPAAIRSIDSLAGSLAGKIARWKKPPTGSLADRALREAIEVLGHIDLWLQTNARDQDPERRILLDKRAAIEALRIRLIGADVFWHVSDSVLTNTQLTYLTIDSVRGLDPKGDTQIFFPMVQKGWILNESPQNKAALVLGEPYRLISSKNIPYDLPREWSGLEQPRFRTPWPFFIVHRATKAERSFSLRVDAGFLGAPRFSVDIQTPVHVAVPGERLVVRLTNHSRDGVRDTLEVLEPFLRSLPMFFRMNAKGSTELDSLSLIFDDGYPEGTSLAEVLIGFQPAGRFVVRKFPVQIDSLRTVLVVGDKEASVSGMAVRRLGVNARWVDPEQVSAVSLEDDPVIVVGEWLGHRISREGWDRLQKYAEQGGSIVVLAQQARVQTSIPGSPIRSALPDASTDTTSAIMLSGDEPLFAGPNDLRSDRWDGWINRRVPHRLTIRLDRAAILAAVGVEEMPAVIRWSIGRGKITYVNLNLHHQFLNGLPAAYRLLANLLAS